MAYSKITERQDNMIVFQEGRFFSWISWISFNILSLSFAVLFLARYYKISTPDSVGFLKLLRMYLPKLNPWGKDRMTKEELDVLKQSEEWDEIVEDQTSETLLGLTPSVALEFGNFSKVIRKHAKQCEEPKLEDLLKKWSDEIIELAEGNDDAMSIISREEIQQIPSHPNIKKRRKQCSIS